jgi:methyltransferase (TIGR00027 family)
VPRIYRYPYEGDPPMMHESAARTTFFDAALARHLKDIDQLVVLGAGFDTRSYRMPQEIRCFEIDAPKTQELKRRLLKKANLDATRITFVPANFLTDDWFANLVNAGFDPAKRTFFLWEAVTQYLDQEAVESTLRRISSTAKGSAVAFDYFHADLISSQSPYWRYIRVILNIIGEPFTFGFAATTPASKYMAEFLASCGLSMEEQRNFGPETVRQPALMGFTTAVV